MNTTFTDNITNHSLDCYTVNNCGFDIVIAAAIFSIILTKDLLPEEQNILSQFFLILSQNILSISAIGFNNRGICLQTVAKQNLQTTPIMTEQEKLIKITNLLL
ncbi:MAG: hypothetical protein N2749_05280 [Clostridia bacterium]|nr:hypothetical protein [Clostridia bacterium]